MTTKKQTPVKLVHFGRGGDTVYLSAGSQVKGYGTPERPHAADCAGKDRYIPDGCPVLDVRAAVGTSAGFSWVFKGPMVNVDLPDGERDPCRISASFADALARHGHAVNIENHRRHRASGSKSPGPLDEVSISEYLTGWRERGARIGHYEAGEIVWED